MQTNDQLEDKSFDSYFEESAKDIINKIGELNEVKDEIVQQGQGYDSTMIINACHEVKVLLFKLLALVVKNEVFVNYDELVQVEDTAIAQRKILEIVYQHLDKFENYSVDGILKKDIMEIYLQEREKNQKMFELVGRYNQRENKQKKVKTVTPRSKVSNIKNTRKK